jgi:hypothetical protein
MIASGNMFFEQRLSKFVQAGLFVRSCYGLFTVFRFVLYLWRTTCDFGIVQLTQQCERKLAALWTWPDDLIRWPGQMCGQQIEGRADDNSRLAFDLGDPVVTSNRVSRCLSSCLPRCTCAPGARQAAGLPPRARRP